MALFPYHSSDEAPEPCATHLKEWERRHGRRSLLGEQLSNYPPLHQAHSAYVEHILWEGTLSEDLKQLIHVYVADSFECEYCADSHRYDLTESLGYDREEVDEIMEGDFSALDEKSRAAIQYSQKMLDDPKRISESDMDALREAGFTDDEIFELTGATGMYMLSAVFADTFSMHPTDVETLSVE